MSRHNNLGKGRIPGCTKTINTTQKTQNKSIFQFIINHATILDQYSFQLNHMYVLLQLSDWLLANEGHFWTAVTSTNVSPQKISVHSYNSLKTFLTRPVSSGESVTKTPFMHKNKRTGFDTDDYVFSAKPDIRISY